MNYFLELQAAMLQNNVSSSDQNIQSVAPKQHNDFLRLRICLSNTAVFIPSKTTSDVLLAEIGNIYIQNMVRKTLLISSISAENSQSGPNYSIRSNAYFRHRHSFFGSQFKNA